MKIIAVLNHKGGVGKTTFTGCTGQALALTGFRVLLIDNDSQHNLTSMMGLEVAEPNMRDVYRSKIKKAPAEFLKSVKKTEIENLHIVTCSAFLSANDIQKPSFLSEVLQACNLERFYDYLLIDNAPGLDTIQEEAIRAADDIFVPTELRQFAINGLYEMEKIINARFHSSIKISKIVPNFYRNNIRQNSFYSALQKLFPGKVINTPIPYDNVFDELVTENKILFLHRLRSKGAAYYLKIIYELFNLDEETIWEKILEKRQLRMSEEARRRYHERLRKNGAQGQQS